MTCLDENTVVALAEGTLGAADRERAQAHLDLCADCRALVAGVARSFGGGRRTRLDRANPPAPPPDESAPEGLGAGARLGRYVLLHRLGEGGMGLVWAAYDPELNRNVAIKQVRRDTDEPLAIARARLKREGQAMARLSHPNVVSVFDLFERDGAFYVAMEWVEGTTLRVWLEEAPRPWREVVAKFVEAGRGLAAAHEAGLIHRDFKPDNVFLGKNGTVRVGDFGLARELDATPSLRAGEAGPGLPRLTQLGAVAGTPAYMAPEQREGQRDVRSDQYSLCAALFEALTGRLPKDTEADEDPHARRRSRPPRRVLRALERGLALRPDDRYPTMDALLVALTADPGRAWRAPLLAAACAGLVLGGIGIYRTALHRHRAQLFAASTGALSGIWSPARALETAHAMDPLIPPERWKRIQARLDDYARQLTRSAAHNCQTSRLELRRWRIVAEPLFDLRAQCLTSAELRLDALAAALEHADATTAEHALLAAGSLPPPSACDDPRGNVGTGDPLSPEAARRRAELDRALAQAEIAVALGHIASLDSAALIAEARAIKDRPLEAEALLIPQGSPEQQEANFYQAAWAAEASHADSLAVRAWTRLAQLLVANGRNEDARRAISQAQATLDRIDPTVALSAPLEEARGQLALRQHLWTKAADHLGKARAQLEGRFGALAPELSPVLEALAHVQEATGQTAVEIATRRRALAILEASHGPEDPSLVDALEPLVKAELRTRRWTEALADARRAVALREQAAQAGGGSTPDPSLPIATYRVGLALARLGRTDEAREVLEQARTRAGAKGADRTLIEMSLANLADPPAP